MFGIFKRRSYPAQFSRYYTAEIPVDLDRIGEFRGDAFPNCASGCWLDQPNALQEIAGRETRGELSGEDAHMCRQFVVEGYYIAKGLIDGALIDSVWSAYEEAIRSGVISVQQESHGEGDPYPGRRLDPHLEVARIRDLQWHPSILRITDLLFGRKTLPFQTIIGHKGSAQPAHSDAIHMTTYPLGFLIANWIALEDIHPDSGPLFYYPKSHRVLPYLLSGDLGIPRKAFKKGEPVYPIYEATLKTYIDAYGLKPETFLPQKGDVLFWHANLVHGGDRRRDLSHSRKALVCHYFAERAVTYHDLSGNLSRLHRNGVYSPVVTDPPL